MEFDKNMLMNNINTLIKERGMKIGSLETEIDISTGYLSRMSKEGNDTMPGIDLIWKLAQKLEVSVDSLVTGDFQRSNDNLFFIMRFLHALETDTNLHAVEWEQFASYQDLQNKYAFSDLPMIDYEIDIDKQSESRMFKSLYDDKMKLRMSTENYCGMGQGLGVILLFKLKTSRNEGSETVYEMYAIEDSSKEQVIPICSTLENDGSAKPFLLDLYNCIDRHERDMKVSEEARNLINRYMDFREQEELPFN